MTTVVVVDTKTKGLPEALDAVFAPWGGLNGVIPHHDGTVYLKPNAVHFTPHAFTDARVLEAVLAYLRDHGYTRLAVMESCSAGSLTRLVFKAIGYTALCRRYRAEPVYLDEGPTTEVDLRDGTRIHVSKRLHDHIVNRGDNFYLGLPKLKTHSMSTVTLGVKNQQAFPVPEDRMTCHDHDTLHRRLAALYDLTQPDFCLVEGLTATAHGHIVPDALLDRRVVPMNLLIGGRDTLAVDAVGARVLGYRVDEVDHLRLCADWGLGEADLDAIDVRGVPLGRFTERLPCELVGHYHPEVHWVVGRTKACVEGCLGNSQAMHELLYADHGGRGGWTLVCGTGFEAHDLEGLEGDVLVVGPCACEEVGEALRRRYPERRVYLVPEHNDLMNNLRCQCRLMGLTPIKLAPLPLWRAAFALLQALWHGKTARIPPPFG